MLTALSLAIGIGVILGVAAARKRGTWSIT